MVAFTTNSHICIAAVSLLCILGQVAQCLSLTTYTDSDEFPIRDITTEEEDAWQRMALVILTRALQTLGNKMVNQLQPQNKRDDNNPNPQTTVRRAGSLFWRTGVLGRPQGKK